MKIESLPEIRNVTGESPTWNGEERRLYWVDAHEPSIQRLDPRTGEAQKWLLPQQIGSFAFCEGEQGKVLAALEDGFYILKLLEGGRVQMELLVRPDGLTPANRLNDGKCDRLGRYWCGSIDRELRNPSGALFRLEPGGRCSTIFDGVIVSNGIAFSPDDAKMYFADSRAETAWVFDFDLALGELSDRRTFVSTQEVAGRVDGATVDAEGNYWCALIHDWTIAQYAPDGRQLQAIRLPVRHPTMCAFGGDDMATLFVTTTTIFLEEDERRAQPLAGAMFAITGHGARGLPEPRFRR